MQWVWVDGQPHDAAWPQDRALAFGHGVFETMAVRQRRLPLWSYHQARLQRGCRALGIPVLDTLEADLQACLQSLPEPDARLKLILTAGSGGIGYASPMPVTPRCVLMAQMGRPSRPNPARVGRSSVILSDQPLLAGLKHINRLEQVLARQELPADLDDLLLLDARGCVIEAISSNLLALSGNQLVRPCLRRSGVDGVMQRYLCDQASARLGLSVQIRHLTYAELSSFDALLLTNAIQGVRWIEQLDEHRFIPVPLVQALTDIAQEVALAA